MSLFLNFYTRSFARSPYKTLFITNGLLSFAGDAAAQLIPIFAGSGAAFDVERSLRFLTYGCSMGPLIGRWNEYLEYKFPLHGPSHSPLIPQVPPTPKEKTTVNAKDFKSAEKAVRDFVRQQELMEKMEEEERKKKGEINYVQLGKRVVADQMVMAPLGLLIFLTSISLLEGMDLPDIWQKVHDLYFKILLVNYKFWPILQLINFRYLPLKYRVPYSASMGVLWTIYLSYVNSENSGLDSRKPDIVVERVNVG